MAPTPSAASAPTEADKIVAGYLALPFPKQDQGGKARSARRNALVELREIPDEAVDAIGRALPSVADPRQYEELLGFLGRYCPTRQSADLLGAALEHADQEVRQRAITGLRLLSRCTGRGGPARRARAARATGDLHG